MSNSIAPGSSADVNVRVTALTTNPNVPAQYKTIILKKNLVNGVNTLTQEMISTTNTKYVVKYDYVLGEDVTIPVNCILEFDGGSVIISGANNTITGTNTSIIADKPSNIFSSNMQLLGTWKCLNGDNILQVGLDYIFKTIEDAYKVAIQNGGGTIIIHAGTYDEAITQPNNSDSLNIHFVGESKESVIWKSTTKGYDYACFTGTGNLTFENIHFIKGTTPSLDTNDIGYALHFDYIGTQGHVIVNECILESYEDAAIGCGTRNNQIIEIKNCELISYGTNDHGAFLYHTAGEPNQTGQKLILENNSFYSEKSLCAISIYNSANNTENIQPVIKNNLVMTAIYGQYRTQQYWNEIVSLSPLVTENSIMSFDVDKCYNNNHNKINGETIREFTPSYIRTAEPLYYSIVSKVIFGSYIDLKATTLNNYPINNSVAPPINLNFPCTIKQWEGSAWSTTIVAGSLKIKTDGSIEVQAPITLDSSHYIDCNFVYSLIPI